MGTLGNVVFIQTKPGLSKIELTKRLSDALEVLGIQRYILLIDVYVEELLGRRPTTTDCAPAKTKHQVKKSVLPRFPILQPMGLANWNQGRNPSGSFRSDETEVLHQVLQAYAEKIHELFGKGPWVLLVECSFQTRFDYVGIQQMGDKLNFEIHWLPIGTKGEMNAKFQAIVSKILSAKEPQPWNKISNIKITNSAPLAVQTLHENLNAFDCTGGNNSVCTFDSLDVVLSSPPFFNTAVGKRSGRDSSASYTSCEDSSSSEDASSGSEIDFEDEVLEVTMGFAKRLPPPDVHRYIAIANENQCNNIVQSTPVFVVLVRDIFPGPVSHISSLLKDTLTRKKIKCKRLAVSTLFVHPTSIDAMKHFAFNQNHTDSKSRLSSGCTSLFINILHFTLSKVYQDPTVIILDLEDERFVRLFRILDFCTRIGQKTLILEKRPDGTFEQNFNRVYAELKKGCIRVNRIRTLKLPKYNLKFTREFLPLDSDTDEDGGPDDLFRLISPDLPHLDSADSHSTVPSVTSSLATSMFEPSGGDLLIPAVPDPTDSPGQQIINFTYQKKTSTTIITPPPVATNNGVSKTELSMRGNSEISAFSAIFNHHPADQAPTIEHSNPDTSKAAESQHKDLKEILPSNGVETVMLDENMNEVLNPVISTMDMRQISDGSGTVAVSRSHMSCQVLFENLGQSAVVTDEEQEPANDIQRRRSLIFPTPSQMCKDMEDYVPGRTNSGMAVDNFGDPSRQSLIQICRLPQKKRRKIQEHRDGSHTSSEESLFKAWVGIPREVVRKRKPGLISRILFSVRTGFRNFILGPLRNALRRTNRITPSQLIRRDWKSSPSNSPTRTFRASPLTLPPAATPMWRRKDPDSTSFSMDRHQYTTVRRPQWRRPGLLSA